jgi:hypothetical protein
VKNMIVPGVIYRFKRGQVAAYSTDPRVYRFAVPADYWLPATIIGDVWITDEAGNVDPGLACSPVPVHRDSLGVIVGRLEY